MLPEAGQRATPFSLVAVLGKLHTHQRLHFCEGTSAIVLMSTSNPAETVLSLLLFVFSFFCR